MTDEFKRTPEYRDSFAGRFEQLEEAFSQVWEQFSWWLDENVVLVVRCIEWGVVAGVCLLIAATCLG